MARNERSWLARATILLVLASVIPYFVAWAQTPDGTQFTGLLFNPWDGNSYIAKIRQGYADSWLFHLPYTSEPQDGAYLFALHLGLGHLARWTSLPLIIAYHLLRMAGGVGMLLWLYGLVSRVTEDVGERRVAFLLSVLGSGLGWLMLPLGMETSDLWIQEAFPGYSLMANAHFPLSIGLMCWIANSGIELMGIVGGGQKSSTALPVGVRLVCAAVALGVIQPFGLVPVFGGLGVMLIARTIQEKRMPWLALAWVVGAAIIALPYPVYMQWAIHSDPVLAQWNSQNTTPSPPLWDWLLSYGLVLALAIPGIAVALRERSDPMLLIVGWLAVTFVGMYLPLPLQRRLSLGLGVSVGLLAGLGWWRVLRKRVLVRRRVIVQRIVLTLSSFTLVLLVLVAVLGSRESGSLFYLSDGEWEALDWLREEGDKSGVVLCAPDTGIFVPAWAGQPVVYGHPFETVDAKLREAQVLAFFRGEMEANEREMFLGDCRVTYILLGPRERALGPLTPPGTVVFETEDTAIYQIDG